MFSFILKSRRWHWWVLVGVRNYMIQFLFYKGHQAVVWRLAKTGGVGEMVGFEGPIDGYWSHFSKRFKHPEQRMLLPRTRFLDKIFKKGEWQDLVMNVYLSQGRREGCSFLAEGTVVSGDKVHQGGEHQSRGTGFWVKHWAVFWTYWEWSAKGHL